jgi:RNA polymerase sigma-70 factor (ECF subfamily)
MSEHEMVLLRQFTETGDAEAFSEITRRYAALVYSTCLRVTGDAECARDATQDTFFQLLKHAGRVTGSLGGWLHQVATRRAVDLVRRDTARRERERAFAAGSAQETDAWTEVSPLVDEAMNEIEPGQRDLLLQHFLQGETTVQMAAAEGVSQPTMSRHVEAALEQLRERLRKKGVGAAAMVLGTMLAGTAQEAPAMVLVELGKMALTTSGSAAASTATATVLGINTKLAIAVVIVAVVGVGGFVAYKMTRSTRPPAAATAISTAPAPVGGMLGSQGFGGGAARPGSMAVAASNSGPPPTRATTDGALTLFSMALVRGDLAQLEECFADAAEAEAFRRVWENPMDDTQRQLQRVFKSVGPRIEVGQTTTTEEGLKVKWIARVRQPFTTTENGTTMTWQRGDRYELETRLKQVGGEWKIVRF